MPTINQLARQQRAQLAAVDAANLKRISEAYQLMYSRLSGDVEALRLAIEAMDKPTQAAIRQLAQYKSLMRKAERELDRFTAYLETVLDRASYEAIQLGLKHSGALVTAAGVTARLQGIAPNAMKQALKYLAEDGPLYARLKLLTGATVDKVSQAIFEGIGAGYNPRKIASLIQDNFGGGLTDALRHTRTASLYSYRDAARANYINSGVVDGWIWWAELDGNQCEACTAEHGSIHGLDETLDGHFNCRCAALPYIEGVTEPDQTGEDWFNSLSEEEKAAYMGQEKYNAYKDGAFSFSDMAQRKENDVYGEMVGVTPLKDLLGNQQSDYQASEIEKGTILPDAEKQIKNNEIETAGIYSKNGELIFSKDGTENRVVFTKEEVSKMKNTVFTHNHPSGTAFSDDDIKLMAYSKMSEIRAVGSEYTYIMKNNGGLTVKDVEKLYQDAVYKASYVNNMIGIVEDPKTFSNNIWEQFASMAGTKVNYSRIRTK